MIEPKLMSAEELEGAEGQADQWRHRSDYRLFTDTIRMLLAHIAAQDQRIAALESRLAAAHDMIRHLEQERDAWPAAYRQRAAMTDKRIAELEAALAEAVLSSTNHAPPR